MMTFLSRGGAPIAAAICSAVLILWLTIFLLPSSIIQLAAERDLNQTSVALAMEAGSQSGASRQ